MKNGITKFVLLIDYHGEYSIKLDNQITKKYIYENVDNYELIFSPLECEIPQEIIEPLQPENNNLKEEIERLNTLLNECNKEIIRLKKENVRMLSYGCLQKEHHKNNVSYLEETISNLECKLKGGE